MLTEGRRVAKKAGKIFVAFYKASAVQENFLEMVGLLRDAKLAFRESLEVYLMNPAQMVNYTRSIKGVAGLDELGVASVEREWMMSSTSSTNPEPV